jgi:hypothetical protein
MANLSGPQLTQLALQAGFPPADAQTASAVALAESSGNPNALNPSGASGLWQILRSAHSELFQQYIWNDPAQNAKMAFIVWQQAGNSFKPWTTYTSGKYRMYLGQTGAANGSGVLAGAGAGGALGDPTAAAQASNATGAQDAATFIDQASDPVFWTRVAMFLAGVFLCGAALHGLLYNTSVYKSIASKATSALAVAAV